MAVEMLDTIKAAEKEADKIRADAIIRGRDILKSVEEANMDAERQAAAEMRTQYQTLMNQKKKEIETVIASNAVSKHESMDALCQDARGKIDSVARKIAERIINHGNC